jgi:hypothetical protein
MLVDAFALARELTQLRKGSGMRHSRLLDRVGPQVRYVFSITAADNVALVRNKVERQIRDLLAGESDELVTVALAALALAPEAGPHLLDRQAWLAERFFYDVRTARRRIDTVFARLVDALVEQDVRRTTVPAADDGWTVLKFQVSLRLDGPATELHEVRTIVVTADMLDRIVCKLSVPPAVLGGSPADVDIRVVSGGELVAKERRSASHFQFTLAPPRRLTRGEIHQYAVVYTLPAGYAMRPHFVYQPLLACDEFDLTVRFDPGAPPAQLWKLGGLPIRMVDDECLTEDQLALRDGEVQLTFRELRQGFAYGVKWSPEPAAS